MTAAPLQLPDGDRPRVNGLWILALLVLGGLAAGAGLYRYKQPQAVVGAASISAFRAATAEGRLAMWHEFTAPQLYGLIAATRISAQQPWLVTHRVGPPDTMGTPKPTRVYGIDVDTLPPIVSRIEGETVRVDLPRPKFLAETVLVGDSARDVPSFSAELSDEAMLGRLHTIAGHLYGTVAGALAKEELIGGTVIELWIEGEAQPFVIEPVDEDEKD